jgi:hypothetical protein
MKQKSNWNLTAKYIVACKTTLSYCHVISPGGNRGVKTDNPEIASFNLHYPQPILMVGKSLVCLVDVW